MRNLIVTVKNWIANLAAILWFFGVLIWVLLTLPFVMIIVSGDMISLVRNGFSTSNASFDFLFVYGLVFGITMLVPAFRRCFRKLPWLYPYITILSADITFLSVAIAILNFGFTVQNDTRHIIFIILAVLQIVVCRLAMCFYCHRKPVKIAREDYE